MGKLKGINEFIYEANRKSFASSSSKLIKEKDGSTTIVYKKDDWKSHDNYFGGEPYGGRQVISYKNKPVWMTVYYGYVDKDVKDMDSIYKFLMEVLRNNSKAQPLRGPLSFKKDKFEYSFKLKGDTTMLFGFETIKENRKIIYRAWHIGGLIDKK